MEIKTNVEGRTLTVRLRGELDHHGARELMEGMDRLIEQNLPASRARRHKKSSQRRMRHSVVPMLLRHKELERAARVGGKLRKMRAAMELNVRVKIRADGKRMQGLFGKLRSGGSSSRRRDISRICRGSLRA